MQTQSPLLQLHIIAVYYALTRNEGALAILSHCRQTRLSHVFLLGNVSAASDKVYAYREDRNVLDDCNVT